MKTNTIVSNILLLCVLLLGTSCSNDDSPEKEPVSVSMKVESVGERSVKLRGEISGEGAVKERGFVYSVTNTNPDFNDTKVTCDNSFLKEIISLAEDTKYYVRAYVITSADETVFSSPVNFTTTSSTLKVFTSDDFTLKKSSVIVSGRIDGASSVEAKGFIYSDVYPDPVTNKGEVVLVKSYSFTEELEVLHGKVYYIRAFAVPVSSTDTVYGNVIKVEGELLPPELKTLEVKNKTRMAAIACGQFVDKGDVKEFGICLAEQANPSIDNIKVVADTDPGRTDEKGVFGVFLDDLKNATAYHIRAYAIALNGEVYYGDNVSFTTEKVPDSEPLTWRWSSNTQGAKDAGHYEGITQAMDSAMYYYKNYSNLGDWIGVEYNTGVATADCNSEGWMRFGPNPRYHWVGTAQHEIAHALGVGTSWNWREMIQYDGERVWKGEVATLTLRVMMKDMTQIIKGDGLHFWPGGINQREEVENGSPNSYGVVIKGADMLKLNAMVLNAMRIDGLAEN